MKIDYNKETNRLIIDGEMNTTILSESDVALYITKNVTDHMKIDFHNMHVVNGEDLYHLILKKNKFVSKIKLTINAIKFIWRKN